MMLLTIRCERGVAVIAYVSDEKSKASDRTTRTSGEFSPYKIRNGRERFIATWVMFMCSSWSLQMLLSREGLFPPTLDEISSATNHTNTGQTVPLQTDTKHISKLHHSAVCQSRLCQARSCLNL